MFAALDPLAGDVRELARLAACRVPPAVREYPGMAHGCVQTTARSAAGRPCAGRYRARDRGVADLAPYVAGAGVDPGSRAARAGDPSRRRAPHSWMVRTMLLYPRSRMAVEAAHRGRRQRYDGSNDIALPS